MARVERRDRLFGTAPGRSRAAAEEEVGAVEALVEALDAGELELLALGQVAGVLPQSEPGDFELAGELGLALGRASFQISRRISSSASVLVPDLPADLIQCVGGQLDEVEGSWQMLALGKRSPTGL